MSDRPRALGIHVYAGGFTLGVSRYFDVAAQLEEINLGYRTAELNFPRLTHPRSRDRWEAILGAEGDDLDLVYGNPPCAPWSQASRGAGAGNGTGRTTQLGLDDERLGFTRTTMETGLRLQPAGAFVLETVARGWTSAEGKALYTEYAEQWQRRGYAVTMLLTDAVLHGLPSMRARAHFIAHKFELPLSEPNTAGLVPKRFSEVNGDLEDLPAGVVANHDPKMFSERYLKVTPYLNQGEHWHDARDKAVAAGAEDPAKGSITLRRLWWDRVALTVVGADQFVHPTRDRFITVREMARLSGYPDSFVFTDKNIKGSEVGRGVTPVMAEYLARLVHNSLDSARPASPTLREVDWTKLGTSFSPGRQK